MGDDSGEAPQSSAADEIEFLLSQDLSADVMFDCFKTSKGNAIVEGSKSSAAKAFKNILAALIDKHAKLKVASREADKYRGELEVASLAVEKYPLDNVRLLGENAGFQATNRVLQDELEKAVRGAPVGLLGPTTKMARARSRSRSAKPQQQEKTVQKKPKAQSNPDPEKKAGYLDGVCETVRERLGSCTRGENGGYCQLLHPKDCTQPACHAKGGREATKCDGWHLFKKYSELKAERKERAKASKERKAAEKKASATARQGKSAKGNDGPGKKAASLGREQRGKTGPTTSGRARHSKKGSQVPHVPQHQGQSLNQQPRVPQPQGNSQQQFYPPGHHEWAANRQPVAYYSQAVPQHSFQATPAVPVYNPYNPLSSQGTSGF